MIDKQNFYTELPEGVSLHMKVRYGYLYFKNHFGYVEYYVELSGVPQYQFLIWFKTVSTWTFPPNQLISSEDREKIKSSVVEFLEQNGITSDINEQ